jgi:hypothetical protein
MEWDNIQIDKIGLATLQSWKSSGFKIEPLGNRGNWRINRALLVLAGMAGSLGVILPFGRGSSRSLAIVWFPWPTAEIHQALDFIVICVSLLRFLAKGKAAEYGWFVGQSSVQGYVRIPGQEVVIPKAFGTWPEHIISLLTGVLREAGNKQWFSVWTYYFVDL